MRFVDACVEKERRGHSLSNQTPLHIRHCHDDGVDFTGGNKVGKLVESEHAIHSESPGGCSQGDEGQRCFSRYRQPIDQV